MDRTWYVVGAVLLLAVAWYLTFTASRLDRLHHRVEGARATLDAQLVRRAEAAVELAMSGLLDPATGLLVAGAASDALAVGEADPGGPAPGADRRLAGRESAESDLTQALAAALGPDVVSGARTTDAGQQLVDRLETAGHRVQLARRFHNQAVTDAQRVRRKRVVRWFRLAGHAELPQTFEMDDELPASLGGR